MYIVALAKGQVHLYQAIYICLALLILFLLFLSFFHGYHFNSNFQTNYNILKNHVLIVGPLTSYSYIQ